MVRATVKRSAAFFHDELSITRGGGGGGGGGGGYESAIAPKIIHVLLLSFHNLQINLLLSLALIYTNF